MSNEIPPREIVDQAGSSSGNNPTETEEDDQAMPNILTSQTRDFSKMSREDVTKYVDKLASYAEAHSLDNQKGVDILLAWEKGGFAPRKREKHFLKAKFPNIPFKTPEWQTWWANMQIMTPEEKQAEVRKMLNSTKRKEDIPLRPLDKES